jgi:hypothetical protein
MSQSLMRRSNPSELVAARLPQVLVMQVFVLINADLELSDQLNSGRNGRVRILGAG